MTASPSQLGARMTSSFIVWYVRNFVDGLR
jgi:hypothetical protein